MNHRIVAAATAGTLALAVPTIMHFEGKRLTGYLDIAGIATSCFGHTKTAVVGKRYTEAECQSLLTQDIREHDDGMRKCIATTVSPHEHAAYLSFTYNVGVASFCKSTLVKKLNSGDRAGACAELSRWVQVNGVRVRGLENRRKAEREMCERGLQ